MGGFMLKYNLAYIFKQKGISAPVGYLMKAGISKASASRLASGKFANIPLATLEKLCLLFKCTPNDLLEWNPPKDKTPDNTQPILGLVRDYSSLIDLRNIGGDIPFEKLSLFAEKMIEVKKELMNQKT